jgi:integrase
VSLATHLQRRRAVYYYRRRLSAVLAQCFDRHYLFISLRTANPHLARRLAVQLDARLETIMSLAEQGELHATAAQLDLMLRAVINGHLAKLDRVAAAAKCSSGFDFAQSRADDRRAQWAYALLDAQGPTAVVRADDQDRMLADGLTERDIGAVQDHLAMLRFNDVVPTKPHILTRLLEATGAPVTAMNLAQAQAVYFRGMHLALAQSDRRFSAVRVEDADVVREIMKNRTATPSTGNILPSAPNLQPGKQVEFDETNSRPQVTVDEITQFAEAIIRQKKSDHEWDDKAQRQARSISALLLKFLKEVPQIAHLGDLRQAHLAEFIDFLRYDIYKFYGRSSKDAAKTIARLCTDALAHPPEKRGIIGDTVNRHCTFLGQVFDFAVRRGADIHEQIDFSKLRAKNTKKVRARNARPKMSLEVVKGVFQTPPFMNCAGWDRLSELGREGEELVFHCALYFVPQLIYYGGGRREEFCGLMVNDVILDNGPIPYIHIAENEQRRIKNLQSQRNLALHPEPLRLGFLDYVRAMKLLGYKLLFPDLFSPTTRSPLGDRFYDQFRPLLVAAGATEAGLGSHAIRHLFGAQLKKARVNEEDRGDLLGHEGGTETSARYCEPHEVERLFELVQKLPVVTAHLKSHPLRLLPWVAERRPPPFSRPSRSKSS